MTIKSLAEQLAQMICENYQEEDWFDIWVQIAANLDLDPTTAPWYGVKDCMHVKCGNVKVRSDGRF